MSKDRRFAYGITIAAALVIALTGYFVIRVNQQDTDQHVAVPNKFAQQITTYQNGDFVYQYSPSDLIMDEEEQVLYAPNIVNIFTEETLSPSEKETLAKKVDGTVVTDICGTINFLQLYVDTENYQQLDRVIQTVGESSGVLYASYEVPMVMGPTLADSNPWDVNGEESDRGQEWNPDGNDWWAEAIGAYSAWEYDDWCSHDVSVGIIDSGFNLDHEDLSGNTTIQMLSGFEQNTPTSHGAGVTGIIGAADNEIGLRGVASSQNHQLNLYCVDWSPVTNNSESDDYITIVPTGKFASAIQIMLQYGVKVVSNSWGFTIPSYNEFNYGDNDLKEDYGNIENTTAIYAATIRQTALYAMYVTLQMIADDHEFLIVQSAGNGVDNGSGVPNLSTNSGAFASITKELFLEKFPDGYQGIDYEELNQHILVVGAVENEQTDDGSYIMEVSSSYGPDVDLCAPGKSDGIFTISSEKESYQQFGNTSAAAPMVSGAAALLWSIDPSLSSEKVWNLLVNNTETTAEGTKDHGHSIWGSEGTYPMLNVGCAVRALMSERSQDMVTEIRVTDQETGEPLEGAEVLYFSGFSDGFQSVLTDKDGCCSFKGASAMYSYPAETIVLIKANGHLRWNGIVYAWLEDDSNRTVNEIEVNLYNVLDAADYLAELLGDKAPELLEYLKQWLEETEPSARQPLEEYLSQLTAQYGVIATGEETYPTVTGYGGGEELVDPARLTGLLGADIFDYDGDGQEELLTVRLETIQPSEGGFSSTWWVISAYEWDPGTETVTLADEGAFTINGLTNSLTDSSFHLSRGVLESGDTVLFLTRYWEMNSLFFGTLRIEYDGTLQVTNGVVCDEMEEQVSCRELQSPQKLSDSLSQWSTIAECYLDYSVLEHRTETGLIDTPEGDILHYAQSYRDALSRMGLSESVHPGKWMNPDRPIGGGAALRMMMDRENLGLRPSERGAAVNGTLTELCGLWHFSVNDMLEQDMTLICYDETGLLDNYR